MGILISELKQYRSNPNQGSIAIYADMPGPELWSLRQMKLRKAWYRKYDIICAVETSLKPGLEYFDLPLHCHFRPINSNDTEAPK